MEANTTAQEWMVDGNENNNDKAMGEERGERFKLQQLRGSHASSRMRLHGSRKAQHNSLLHEAFQTNLTLVLDSINSSSFRRDSFGHEVSA